MSENQTSYSQWGDDLLCLEYFKGKNGCTFLEAGANDPVLLSQTYLLERNGWTGVLVEPVPQCCDKLRRLRPNSKVFQNALGAPSDRGSVQLFIPNAVTELTRKHKPEDKSTEGILIEAEFATLTEILLEAGIDQLTYLSLDLEGMEEQALKGLDFEQFNPELIIIEDRLNNLRSHKLLKAKGYKLVRRNGSNNWYVPFNSEFPIPIADNIKLFRKLYLSMPFRWLRRILRRALQKSAC